MLIKIVIFCCYLALAVGYNYRQGREGIRQATFERFDNKCAGRNAPIIFDYSAMRNDGGKIYINSTINVKEDISENLKMVVTIKKCKTKENLDTCEPFYVYKVDDYCEMISSDTVAYSALWKPFFGAYQPSWKCPFKKGHYVGTDCMLDVSSFLMFPIDKLFWSVKSEVFDKNTEKAVMCILAEAHIVTN